MPNNCILLYDDQSSDIIFSGPAWTLPLTNMQDPRPSLVARSADATNAKTQFFMAFSAAQTLPGFIFTNTNLTSAATWRFTGYSDAGFSIQTFTSGVNNVWTSGQTFIDPDGKGMPVLGLFDSLVTSRYWQAEFMDAANPAGYVDLGLIFAGIQCNLTFNFAPSSTFSRDPNTSTQKALTGTPYFNRHKNVRTLDLQYPNEVQDVAFDEVDKMWEKSGNDRPVAVIPFPDDLDRRQRQSFVGNLTKLSPLQMLNVNLVSTGMTVTEYV